MKGKQIVFRRRLQCKMCQKMACYRLYRNGIRNWNSLQYGVPITHKSPLFDIQGIHTNIKEDKNLTNERQGRKSMPEVNVHRFKPSGKQAVYLFHVKRLMESDSLRIFFLTTYLVVILELSVTLCQV